MKLCQSSIIFNLIRNNNVVGKKYAIFGIDPGATSAVCALDLNGTLIQCRHIKEGGRENISLMINSIGIPSAIATDKMPAPDTVRKVAAGYNAILFVPSRELTENEKTALARGKGFENAHVRDAYSAAMTAYNSYANKLRQIDSLGISNIDEVKHRVINGSTMFSAIASVSAALEQKAQEEELEKANSIAHNLKSSAGTPSSISNVRDLLSRSLIEINHLSEQNANLKKALSIEREKSNELSVDLQKHKNALVKEISSDPIVRKLNGRIARLEDYIRFLKYRLLGKARKNQDLQNGGNVKASGTQKNSSGKQQNQVQPNKTVPANTNPDIEDDSPDNEDEGIDIEKIINDYRVKKED